VRPKTAKNGFNAVAYNNESDIEALKKFTSQFLFFCDEYEVECLDPNISDDNYYIDIVHFNRQGHIKMAELLYAKLNK
jgi:lysophospholipase L1-like esterase